MDSSEGDPGDDGQRLGQHALDAQRWRRRTGGRWHAGRPQLGPRDDPRGLHGATLALIVGQAALVGEPAGKQALHGDVRSRPVARTHGGLRGVAGTAGAREARGRWRRWWRRHRGAQGVVGVFIAGRGRVFGRAGEAAREVPRQAPSEAQQDDQHGGASDEDGQVPPRGRVLQVAGSLRQQRLFFFAPQPGPAPAPSRFGVFAALARLVAVASHAGPRGVSPGAPVRRASTISGSMTSFFSRFTHTSCTLPSTKRLPSVRRWTS
jgi:hypothetical protein